MFRRILATSLIASLILSTLIDGLFAYEGESVNSLDSLPYSTPVDEHIRETLLDNPALTQTEKTNKTISFEKKEDASLVTLLADKRSFEQGVVLSPVFSGFILDPFQGFFSSSPVSGSGIMELPILPPETTSTGALFTDILPTQAIHIDRKIGKKDIVASSRGALTVSFSTGTTISTLSGDMIDPAKIGFLPLGSFEKSKAKAKYEKKMKNRGTKKRGLAEAAVEGFEFGLSGTHLIFSSPVALSIDTPNMGEGMVVDLMTMHAGDTDFHTGGLSISPDTLCNSDGSASIPGSEAVVKNGKVIFYTCGASSFTMNPTGGTAGSNDLRIIIGDCAQAQIYYNNLTQIYTGNPAATGCGLPGLWAALRIGATTYGNGVDGVTATAWTTQSTTGSTSGNTYKATSTMTALVGGLTYSLIIDWVHTAPNKYLTWSYRVVVPPANVANIRFYFANDSFVAGADTNDTGYFTNTGGQTIGVYDSVANVLSAFRYTSGALWTAYEAGPYATVAGRITGGTDFANTYVSSGDLGFGVDWNFGTGANITYSGTVEWRMLPYVAGNVPDLIPGIGAPEGPLTTNLLSQMPITVTNAGNLASSGVHTVVLTIPANITGPASSFSDNGWSCGAQVGTGVTCTKTTAISTPLGSDTVRIPVTPTLAASGTNVTFNVAISNPGDSNITNNTAFSINPVIGASTSDPGGITGENLWLQANSGTNCTTTGCTITTWSNLGGLGISASGTTGLGTVTYDPVNRINRNPTLYFNNASLNSNNNLGITTTAVSIFTVTNIAAGGSFLIGTQTATNSGLEWATSPTLDRLRFYSGTTFYNGANGRSTGVPAITSTTRITGGAGTATSRTNGLQTLTAGSVTSWAGANIGIGRISTMNSTLSNLAETIIYPSSLTLAQQNRIESYLALKYGITLDQTVPNSYLLSNGTVVWSSTGAGTYKNNITGIARDDLSTLNQPISQSVTNTGDIIVSKSSIATNRMALTWAHDGASASSFTGTDSPTGFQRITREWLMQEKNGDLGTVTISYPGAAVATGFTVPLMLLIDTDSVFATGSTAYTGTYNTGAATWDFSLNIADMQYITFAKTVSSDTTPPTILSNTVASGTLAPNGTFPITIIYSDTGSAINAASLTGKIYAWDSTGATWSPTNTASPYLTISSSGTSTGVFQLTGLPFGKYRFDFSIADTVGNTATQSYTYYIDGLIWTISAASYDIGPAQTSIQTFGTGELLLTVQTVGAAFDLSMLRTADMTYLSDTITVYSGSTGWGYDKNIGSGYSSTITAHGTTQTIVSTPKAINTNGQRNTFTYRVKFGVNASANTPAGDYANGIVRFGINLTY